MTSLNITLLYSCFALHSREWRDLHSINKIDDRNVLCSGSSTLSQTSLLNRFCFPNITDSINTLTLMKHILCLYFICRHLYLPICNLVKVCEVVCTSNRTEKLCKTTHCAEHLPGLISVRTVQPRLSKLRLLENLINL